MFYTNFTPSFRIPGRNKRYLVAWPVTPARLAWRANAKALALHKRLFSSSENFDNTGNYSLNYNDNDKYNDKPVNKVNVNNKYANNLGFSGNYTFKRKPGDWAIDSCRITNLEFDEEVENVASKFYDCLIPHNDYKVSFISDNEFLSHFYIEGVLEKNILVDKLSDSFYQLGVSDMSESSEIIIELCLIEKSDKPDDESIMSTNVIKGEKKNLNRTSVLTQALDEMVRYKVKKLTLYDTQLAIENILWDNYQLLDNESYIKGLNLNLLDSVLKHYIFDNKDNLISQWNKFKNYFKRENLIEAEKFYQFFLSDLDITQLINLSYNYFIRIAIFSGSDETNYIYLNSIAKEIGKSLINKKLYNIKRKEKTKDKYGVWYDKWKVNNKELNDKLIDDTYVVGLGSQVIGVLIQCEMIEKKLIKVAKDSSIHILQLKSKELLNRKEKSIVNFPNKLPMIVKPLEYNHNKKGGYLLNNVKYDEDVIIDKNCYALKTTIKENSDFYEMINGISNVPFKVNTELLDYIKLYNDKHNFCLNPNTPHEYENITKRSAYQESEYKAHKSKIILENTILNIAEFYKDYKQIYFPVRSDQRGRLYCMPHYFNYQSSELSKALLLFSNPGQVGKNNLGAIKYLQIYGANCFGLSKRSNEEKIKWVNNNEYDIINFDKSCLLDKAKDKLLFLAFCLEYRKFTEFVKNEEVSTFLTYLPIQLDASCNGIQHLALLSNEKILFKELNLIVDEEDKTPKDFYSFLLYKLIIKFQNEIFVMSGKDSLTPEEINTLSSYKRLSDFGWDRAHVKKAIMTITYNASRLSMVDFIKSNLVKINPEHCSVDDDWYITKKCSKDNVKKVNVRDIFLLVDCIRQIVTHDFERIKKLTKYLKNVATVLNILELPIMWNLPHGLQIKQSYLETKSTAITPFMYDKSKINIRVTIKDKYDKKKQIRALMPNLIHSLDSSSLSLLYIEFSRVYPGAQFYSVHDCFGTTMEKIDTLKTLLASVYTDIYSRNTYLNDFDECILNNIENHCKDDFDRNNRTVLLPESRLPDNLYHILDVDWVNNSKRLDKDKVKAINSQYILI